MKKLTTALLGAWFLLFGGQSAAYEPETHATISGAAVNASRLALDPSLLKDVGIESSQKFRNSKGDSDRSILQLFQDGARFEDDFPRPANHFYNPLTGQGVPGFSSSPNWAIDGEGDLSTTKFSFRAAREYMFNALTDSNESFRLKQFGLMFQSLGQVMHHIQDMAQPQHTRDDAHCDIFPCRPIGQFAPSLYEKYTDTQPIRESLNFLGYAPVYGQDDTQTFNAARKFWHTPDGKGMADYSNRGFVSAGTNFDKPGLFPAPVFDPSKADHKDIQQLCREEAGKGRPCPNQSLTGTITFYGSDIEDRFRPSTSAFNPRTSSYSVFDPDLTRAGRTPVFSLNRFNFYTAHDFLIPRSVGYSAGLIDYFFRGKIDYVRNPADPTSRVIKNLGTEPMAGMFALYYDDAQNVRKEVRDRLNNPVVWDTRVLLASAQGLLAPGATMPADAQFDPPADAKERNLYMLVFKGDMGEEKADEAQGVVGAVASKLIAPELARVAAGAGHSLVIKTDGTLLAFGENSSGQVGNGSFSFFPDLGVATPTAVAGLQELTAVAGGHHTLALKKDGSLFAWGNNGFGELGVGTLSPDAFPLPQPVTVPGPGKVIAVSGGWVQSYALKDDGTVWAWGANASGGLGDGSLTDRHVPVQVMTGVAALAKGGANAHMLVLKRDGTVWAWGLNRSGQLGDGTRASSPPFGKATPVRVFGLPADVVALAAGGFHSLALTSNGTVWAWGENVFLSSLGTGIGGDFIVTPVPVQGLTEVTAIAAGDGYSLALRKDKTVWAWGTNGVGQLGNGSFTAVVPVPAQVQGPTGVTGIAAGEFHSLAMQADGKLWSWGYNFRGALGDGTFIPDDPFGRAVPQIVLDASN